MAENKERIEKWVKGLESGKYRKAEGSLREDSNTYCALGVACKIYEKETGQEVDYNNNDVLPIEVKRWYGLSSQNPKIKLSIENEDEGKYSEAVEVTELNDEWNFSLKAIGKMVRKKYLETVDNIIKVKNGKLL